MDLTGIPTEHEVRRWCRLLEHDGIACDPTELGLSVPAGAPRSAESYVIVHPGAASGARRWPPERWAAVVRGLSAAGQRAVLTGSAAERTLTATIVALAGVREIADVAGQTGVCDLAALVAGARCVIAGDTGVGHLASAYARPSVLLFGPTPPAQWGPPDHARHRVLWAGHAGDPHAAKPDAGLLAITPRDVLAAARDAQSIGKQV